jgi:hypothetical protein
MAMVHVVHGKIEIDEREADTRRHAWKIGECRPICGGAHANPKELFQTSQAWESDQDKRGGPRQLGWQDNLKQARQRSDKEITRGEHGEYE